MLVWFFRCNSYFSISILLFYIGECNKTFYEFFITYFPTCNPAKTEVRYDTTERRDWIRKRFCIVPAHGHPHAQCHVPLLDYDDFYPPPPKLRFDKLRFCQENPCFPIRSCHIKATLKAVPTHETRPYLIRSAWYQTAKNGYRGKMITAFPHFQLLRRSLRLRPNTVSL